MQLVGRHWLAELIRDIAQVAQGAGKVPFLDVGIEVSALSAADSHNEILEVVLVFAVEETSYFLAVFVEDDAALVATGNRIAVGTFENHPDARSLVVLRLQAADFEH